MDRFLNAFCDETWLQVTDHIVTILFGILSFYLACKVFKLTKKDKQKTIAINQLIEQTRKLTDLYMQGIMPYLVVHSQTNEKVGSDECYLIKFYNRGKEYIDLGFDIGLYKEITPDIDYIKDRYPVYNAFFKLNEMDHNYSVCYKDTHGNKYKQFIKKDNKDEYFFSNPQLLTDDNQQLQLPNNKSQSCRNYYKRIVSGVRIFGLRKRDGTHTTCFNAKN